MIAGGQKFITWQRFVSNDYIVLKKIPTLLQVPGFVRGAFKAIKK